MLGLVSNECGPKGMETYHFKISSLSGALIVEFINRVDVELDFSLWKFTFM